MKKGSFDLDIPNEGIDLKKVMKNLKILVKPQRTRGIKKKAASSPINFRSMRYRLENTVDHAEMVSVPHLRGLADAPLPLKRKYLQAFPTEVNGCAGTVD
jgi:hypothetical protein